MSKRVKIPSSKVANDNDETLYSKIMIKELDKPQHYAFAGDPARVAFMTDVLGEAKESFAKLVLFDHCYVTYLDYYL